MAEGGPEKQTSTAPKFDDEQRIALTHLRDASESLVHAYMHIAAPCGVKFGRAVRKHLEQLRRAAELIDTKLPVPKNAPEENGGGE